MSTSLTTIYDAFLTKVTDYTFIHLNEDGLLEEVLYKYLTPSIVRFTSCKNDLTMDKATNAVTGDLTPFEIEILASLMTINYSNSKILNIKNMEQILSDKEYKIYSTANHLSQLVSLKNHLQGEVSHLMIEYSYSSGLSDWS